MTFIYELKLIELLLLEQLLKFTMSTITHHIVLRYKLTFYYNEKLQKLNCCNVPSKHLESNVPMSFWSTEVTSTCNSHKNKVSLLHNQKNKPLT